MKPRLVLDTNVWLDWLVFDDPGIAAIRDAAQCRRIARRSDTIAAPPGALPACRDPDDQKFLETAFAAKADFLVTKDRELLALGKKPGRLPFRIVTPAQGIVR